ncbi:MAG TPA: fused MFS/spermidine synthase [Candidatus Polarisedimenticolaceae bacterium]|nr:fused MFS/spermidine synthase [Candidatus Polarisedimenticolaceae bacterium]
MVVLLYLLFFLSGAAALVYEVVWARSLALVFGGSHLAVATVLSVFMGGLALGGWLLGRAADRSRRPLRLYALLELGIAAAALLFEGLLRAYPAIYPPLARLGETSPVWLTLLRVLFAVAAMLLPTTLMGGTLPVLSRLIARQATSVARHLSLLYGINTLGAVLGTLSAGFVLLPRLGVRGATAVAVGINVCVGLVALGVAGRFGSDAPSPAGGREDEARARDLPSLPFRLVLLGIGISGFCALAYEVLWTRVLSMVFGTSVYTFTIMLVAFLAGIAVGGQGHTLLSRAGGWRTPVLVFACTQVAIGLCALGASYALGQLPAHASGLQTRLGAGQGEFLARQASTFLLAFAYMAVPAFFMGLAFPLAGTIHARRRGHVGAAVGEVLAVNTVGAILGAASAGFLLIRVFGIERALQLLVAVNLGTGLLIAASLLPRPRVSAVLGGTAAVGALALVALLPSSMRFWDPKFLAVYRNNQRQTFDSPEHVRDALRNTDVLYWFEGINETISVIQAKGGTRAFVVNGRVEASTHLEDVQCQRTLGHLPMLAHPAPRKVFVLGTGSGMTLGSVLVHPGVESVTLAEIEPGVFGATRTFGRWNHGALDAGKLRIVRNDGRNFLWTTRERFDVITADPIHPWSGGAAYLYTDEYFRTVSSRLAPGGVACQWLPIYELTLPDLRSVVATFARNFRHVALWLTYADAELLGSDVPIRFDRDLLASRLQDPTIHADLAEVGMGTPDDFMALFLAGDDALRTFARTGKVNTDDNLSLEFSAPRAQGRTELVGQNFASLAGLRRPPGEVAPWARANPATAALDRLQVLALQGADPEGLAAAVGALTRTAPPGGRLWVLQRQAETLTSGLPRPLASASFPVLAAGVPSLLDITAVAVRTGTGRAALIFVDNAARDVYGERYLEAPEDSLDGRVKEEADRVLGTLREEHALLVAEAGGTVPTREATAARLRARVATWVAAASLP